MNIADVLDGSDTAAGDAADELTLWLEVPPGYLALPVADPATVLGDARERMADLVPPEHRALVDAVLGTLAVMLIELERRSAAYCGLGWHTDTDGAIVGSSLVVSLQVMPERRSPRLLLKDMLVVMAEAGDQGQADLVDLGDRPALFLESVRSLPRPRVPGAPPPEPAEATVYQLRAMVPSSDGTRLAVIEFATPEVERGPRFREMVVLLAHSVRFTPPARTGGAPVGLSITDALKGL